MKHLISLLLLCCIPVITRAQSSDASLWDDPRWGDLGDGTFANPLILADYSDPDVIRVGNKYYMTCSEFHFMGMPILESDDMKNEHRLSVSTDGEHFTPVGETFQEGDSDWKGYRIALYSYTTQDQGGKARFTDFQYKHDGPK